MTVSALLPLLLVASLSMGAGCSGESETPSSSGSLRLQEAFPEQASQVLEGQGDPVVATPQGFSLGRSAEQGAWHSVQAELPRDAAKAIQIRGPGGFEVRARELGAEGESTVIEGAVAYRRPGGTSYWTATSGGVEEWLHLEAGRAFENEVVAAWEIDGASLRQRGESVELVDEDGIARLWVEAPIAFSGSGRPVIPKLEVHDNRLSLSVDAAGEEVLIDPLWTAAAPITTARRNHTATLLGDGRVMVAGGEGASTMLSSVELYNPVTNTWTPGASMSHNHTRHTAVALDNGKVLVISGMGVGYAELYDPAANTWAPGGTLLNGNKDRAAVVLQNGKVLVMGGNNNNVMAFAELYDPATNTWSATASMSVPREHHTATLLPNGKVLVVGGNDLYYVGGAGYGLYHATPELYDPATGTWTAAAPMSDARSSHTATLLQNGKVLVSGGFDAQSTLRSTELYDPATNSWAPGASPSVARAGHTATLLSSGKVVVAAGSNTDSSTGNPAVTEMYDPATNTWLSTSMMSHSRSWHSATLLSSGDILLAGGHWYQPLASTELFSPTLGNACSSAGECGSGLCVDGVCCNSACGGGVAGDCQSCNTVGSVGACKPIPAATVCRGAADVCDAVEACDGQSTACPADTLAVAGTTCRGSAGACDAAEACTGASAACPADTLAAAGTTCRGSADICDVAETCTGASTACPADTLVVAGTQCRGPAGICDVAETCTGASTACPADTLAVAGTQCRGSAGICDVAEACTGASVACPADTLVVAGASCRASVSACDATETCTGASVACPADAAMANGTGCSGGSCFSGTCKTADVAALAAGGVHSLAVKTTGEVWAWGSDTNGQLGNGGGSANSASPVLVTGLAGVTAVSGGGLHSLALLDNGEVWAWGSDVYGQIGDGGVSVNRQAPVKAVGLPDFAVVISAGGSHSLALLADGTVWSWGRNTYGQLGVGGSNSQSPVLVSGLPTQAVAIAAGGDHSLAVLADGTVWSWGRDIYGQLGNGGSAINSATPVQVIDLPDLAMSVAAGGNHSLVLLGSGEVWAWGYDSNGQVGNGGASTNAAAPVQVVGLSDLVTAIAAGANHSLALLASGDVMAWGADTSGQLGDGAGATNRQSPVAVAGSTEVSMLAAGTSHSLALRLDTSAWAWGQDSSGQLGDDPAFSSSRYTPVQTVMP